MPEKIGEKGDQVLKPRFMKPHHRRQSENVAIMRFDMEALRTVDNQGGIVKKRDRGEDRKRVKKK